MDKLIRGRLLRFLLFFTIHYVAVSALAYGEKFKAKRTPMHKVLLTQKGYIQFLRWELPVPTFDEFTFCLWVKSNNLTYAHSIFSYSKDERDRLVRSWISPAGRSIHLEIGDVQVFQHPSLIVENRWYHICQSWESHGGRYGLWINGHIEAQGHSEETRGHVVPAGGDIVLGQEYTDFDKGLEEGIEGAVLGFNLLLSSAFPPLFEDHLETAALLTPQSDTEYSLPYIPETPIVIKRRGLTYPENSRTSYTRTLPRRQYRRTSNINPISFHSSWSRSSRPSIENESTNFIRRIKGPVTMTTLWDLFSNETKRNEGQLTGSGSLASPLSKVIRRESIIDFNSNDHELNKLPLGLQLIKLSYFDCESGRGSPRIGGPLMLISWSRTPVKVFGGAILKNARSDCGNF